MYFFMNSNAIAAKQKADSSFRKRGVIFAMMSGVYGLYTAFLTLGQASGVWGADWYGANTSGLSVLQ